MPEVTPTIIQTVLLIFLALVGREGLGFLWKHYLGKSKSDAEIDGLHLSNADKKLHGLQDAIEAIEKLREKYEKAAELIEILKQDKIADDREKARKDGVITEQRATIKELYENISLLRIRERDLEERLSKVEATAAKQGAELSRMNSENLQLKAMVEKYQKQLEHLQGGTKD